MKGLGQSSLSPKIWSVLRVSFSALSQSWRCEHHETKRYSEEQIGFALRQAESGTPVLEVCRKMGVTEVTFYRWKKKSPAWAWWRSVGWKRQRGAILACAPRRLKAQRFESWRRLARATGAGSARLNVSRSSLKLNSRERVSLTWCGVSGLTEDCSAAGGRKRQQSLS
mgnify:CR=1 FL=1